MSARICDLEAPSRAIRTKIEKDRMSFCNKVEVPIQIKPRYAHFTPRTPIEYQIREPRSRVRYVVVPKGYQVPTPPSRLPNVLAL